MWHIFHLVNLSFESRWSVASCNQFEIRSAEATIRLKPLLSFKRAVDSSLLQKHLMPHFLPNEHTLFDNWGLLEVSQDRCSQWCLFLWAAMTSAWAFFSIQFRQITFNISIVYHQVQYYAQKIHEFDVQCTFSSLMLFTL